MTISNLDNRESFIALGEVRGIPGLAHSVAQESQVGFVRFSCFSLFVEVAIFFTGHCLKVERERKVLSHLPMKI